VMASETLRLSMRPHHSRPRVLTRSRLESAVDMGQVQAAPAEQAALAENNRSSIGHAQHKLCGPLY
jgi:hypothetical protein